MKELLLSELAILSIALVSNYLTWWSWTSKEMIEMYAPFVPALKNNKLNAASKLEAKRKAGYTSDNIRAVAMCIFSTLGVAAFLPTVDLRILFESHMFRWVLLLFSAMGLIMVSFFGPRDFAIRDSGTFRPFTKSHFRKYVLPMWAWIGYALALLAGLGAILLMVIATGVSADIKEYTILANPVGSAVNNSIVILQDKAIRLVQLGHWIAYAAQKYIVMGLLSVMFLLLEVRSSMYTTVVDSFHERLKTIVWLLIIATFGVCVIAMPNGYQNMHQSIVRDLERTATVSGVNISLKDVMDIQRYLDEHDLKWLLISTLTGYGNLLSIGCIAIGVYIWRAYFSNVELNAILELLLPKYLLRRFGDILKYFQVDFRIR